MEAATTVERLVPRDAASSRQCDLVGPRFCGSLANRFEESLADPAPAVLGVDVHFLEVDALAPACPGREAGRRVPRVDRDEQPAFVLPDLELLCSHEQSRVGLEESDRFEQPDGRSLDGRQEVQITSKRQAHSVIESHVVRPSKSFSRVTLSLKRAPQRAVTAWISTQSASGSDARGSTDTSLSSRYSPRVFAHARE